MSYLLWSERSRACVTSIQRGHLEGSVASGSWWPLKWTKAFPARAAGASERRDGAGERRKSPLLGRAPWSWAAPTFSCSSFNGKLWLLLFNTRGDWAEQEHNHADSASKRKQLSGELERQREMGVGNRAVSELGAWQVWTPGGLLPSNDGHRRDRLVGVSGADSSHGVARSVGVQCMEGPRLRY